MLKPDVTSQHFLAQKQARTTSNHTKQRAAFDRTPGNRYRTLTSQQAKHPMLK
jgi:hypothetical protein